jgi:hypothetical protein
MSLPPAILDLHIAPVNRKPVHVWLPLFLLWPLLLVLAVLALVMTILADVVLAVLGDSYHRYTILLIGLLGLMWQTQGTAFRVNDGQTSVSLTIQ